MLTTIPGSIALRNKERRVICTTCGLKKCVGRCHWERVENPRPKRAVARRARERCPTE